MDYDIVIGLEVHVELKTKSKIFCSCTTSFGGEPNTHCCPICTGMPGTLPVINNEAFKLAIKAGIATNCDITKTSILDRKNYFYPDLPKAYQISQLYHPLCVNGYIPIKENKKVRIREIHMEEDAGKLIHNEYTNSTNIDFNRCGVPLIEIVTMPDMSNASEVDEFLQNLKLILEYVEASDCKMQEGSLRVDVNLSVNKKGDKLGTRTEMKNLNSFKAIKRAIEDEAKRQISLIESGKKVIQETRKWDDGNCRSFSMRNKEEAHDYRYFPEPDIPPLKINDDMIDKIKTELPVLPKIRLQKYINEYELSETDAKILVQSKILSDFYDRVIKNKTNPQKAANWIMREYMRLSKDSDTYIFKFKPKDLATLISLIDEGKITANIAKDVFEIMYNKGENPENIIKEKGLAVVSDQDELSSIIDKVILNNPESVSDYESGKKKAIGFLIGQVMQKTKGQADPKSTKKILEEKMC